MKVLVVTTWFPSASAPASGVFVRRDVELLRRTHEVDVLHLHPHGAVGPTDAAPGVRRLAMSTSNPVDILRASRALRAGLARYDLVHTMSPSALLPFAPLRVRIPWVHTEHWSALLDASTVGLPARLGLGAALRLMRRPDVVVAVSSALAEHLEARLGRTVEVIPNAVDAPEQPRPRPPAGGPLRLVAVGGLIPRKGPDLAVEAVAELRRRGRDARLRWIGDGPSRAEIGALARRLGVDDVVDLPGGLAPEGVAAALAESDLFLLPTSVETFGVSIAEALLSGRPVVVGANGGQRDFVAEPDGILVAERTGIAYADAVERSLELARDRSADDIAAPLRSRVSPAARAAAYDAAYRQAVLAHG
ncbi:GDP-mannose-dependent alpha-(1-6)-phosphatidylinositol monomannoside mannosyltransferase [Agromyces sp. NDB4Y10]|uniref:glycosyltransferase family 4 protein n=1 Tax=Agromyces sp. NDB4Y10 TaxID=1775951 RepID=UPI0007B21DDD|nr:glycosyltransferase family 4 protein [Agromyces sp. NDB4Y10]KZE92123.1 GDP-mannose-dependent alpha-(1-6)-phosphatidylinositol monomannoside mannosyltransferase [Agromyces sp. NDB4Y10]